MSKDVDAAELSGDEAYRSKKKEPLSLTFDGVVVGIPAENGVAGGERLILNGVSGYCEPGSVTALMGATGSGKTTLLSALANRLEVPTRLSTASRIRYGGEAWSKSLKRLVGFVEQDDIVVPELTVRQTLRFAARLRLPADTEDSALKLERRVNEVIDQLALGKCVDTPIGSVAARGVSGGERKRVCIASELLAEPRLLFLDEPTSGLDSETALVLVRSLRRLAAEEGVTIVCSIHQPNSQVFTNFQQLCFLHAGRMVFFGEAQAASLAHFSGLVGSKCPAHYNPPDWYMELAVGGKLETTGSPAESAPRSEISLEEFNTTSELSGEGDTAACWPMTNAASSASDDLSTSGSSAKDSSFASSSSRSKPAPPSSSVYAVSFQAQVSVLFDRMTLRLWRQKWTAENVRLWTLIGMLWGLLGFGLGKAESDIDAHTGSVFISVVPWMFFATTQVGDSSAACSSFPSSRLVVVSSA